ncbi:hypothetical protein F511_16812 [Dorcoceras hygrometricum]|uniref:Uncharacterized protein n=1 Tax=Dorcoceras hygrometricum TaxID=472368 RepID=A0A2Z7CC19_9LAMI|nr:hypothetical protein F511_16812 [Dorcoceras hygrometricum]
MESAAGLAMETSKVESAVHGLREQSQESAGSLFTQTQERSDVVEDISSRKILFTSRCYLELAIAKRCRLHKLIRKRFAIALKIQQEDFALITSRKIQSRTSVLRIQSLGNPVASYSGSSRKIHSVNKKRWIQSRTSVLCIQSQRFPVTVRKQQLIQSRVSKPAVAMQDDEFSRSDKPVAKQLTIYEEFEEFSRVPVQARRRKTHVYVVSHTVAAVVHLWSLGVLTAAGCGIGSVHDAVRSNLLVEPSEVMSSYSADGLREQSQESAGSLFTQTQERSDVIEEISSRKLLFTSRCYLELAIAKRCRLHKLIRLRFALALKIQQEDFALITSRKIQSRTSVLRIQSLGNLVARVSSLQNTDSKDGAPLYLVTDKESTQEVADASPVKQAPKKTWASKKRPAAVPVEAPVVKKKRSLKKKSSYSQSTLEMVVVAQEAIPIQIIHATPAVEPMVEDQQAKIVETHPAIEVAVTAGEQEPVGEQAEEQPVVESSLEKPAAEGAAEETAYDISEKADVPIVEPVIANVENNEVSNANDVDTIIQQVLSETVQSASTEEEQVEELDIRGSAGTGSSTCLIRKYASWFRCEERRSIQMLDRRSIQISIQMLDRISIQQLDQMLKTRAVESDVKYKRSGSSYEQKNNSDVKEKSVQQWRSLFNSEQKFVQQ